MLGRDKREKKKKRKRKHGLYKGIQIQIANKYILCKGERGEKKKRERNCGGKKKERKGTRQ